MTTDELRRLERFMEECGIGIDDIIKIVKAEMERENELHGYSQPTQRKLPS